MVSDYTLRCHWSIIMTCWHQLRREGFDVARRTVARLMKDMDIQGIIRGQPHRTTIPDRKAPCPLDRVNRQFRVPAPNRLWVSDFIGNITPAEAEANFYAALETEPMAA